MYIVRSVAHTYAQRKYCCAIYVCKQSEIRFHFGREETKRRKRFELVHKKGIFTVMSNIEISVITSEQSEVLNAISTNSTSHSIPSGRKNEYVQITR